MQRQTFYRLVVGTAIVLYALIVVSGMVRITGSEIACPGWPLCEGQLLPASTGAWLELSHRLLMLIAGALIVVTAQAAWHRRHEEQDRWTWQPPLVAAGLLVLQMVAGVVILLLNIPWLFVVVTVGFQTIMLACIILSAVALTVEDHGSAQMAAPLEPDDTRGAQERAQARVYRRLVLGTALASWILILVGGTVAGTGSGMACIGFPDCNGEIIPTSGGIPVIIHMTHRMTAYVVILLVLAVFGFTVKERWRDFVLIQWILLTGGLLMTQATIGGANSLLAMPLFLRGLHLAAATAYWGSMVVFSMLVVRRPLLSGLDSSGRILQSKTSQ